MRKSTKKLAVIINFPEQITPEQMTILQKKAETWRDACYPSERVLTAGEVEAQLVMQDSFYPAREWVGIHFSNMVHMAFTWEKMKQDVTKRLIEKPNLVTAYNLFMKPFCQQ